MEFRIARAARVTGEMLERLVREKLVAENNPEPDAVVCYGSGYAGAKPALNARCSTGDKMEQGIILSREMGEAALGILPINGDLPRPTPEHPLIARKRRHTKGKDIRVCKSLRQLILAREAGRDFVTPFVESDTEYRVWVFRKRILAVYEKRLTEPDKNVGFGRNRAKGWTFHALPSGEIPETLRTASRAAIEALGLDFGAVDVLGKRNANGSTTCCVLEVNSAPGVSDEHRTAIVKLVHRIVRWCANGCPTRRNDATTS